MGIFQTAELWSCFGQAPSPWLMAQVKVFSAGAAPAGTDGGWTAWLHLANQAKALTAMTGGNQAASRMSSQPLLPIFHSKEQDESVGMCPDCPALENALLCCCSLPTYSQWPQFVLLAQPEELGEHSEGSNE